MLASKTEGNEDEAVEYIRKLRREIHSTIFKVVEISDM